MARLGVKLSTQMGHRSAAHIAVSVGDYTVMIDDSYGIDGIDRQRRRVDCKGESNCPSSSPSVDLYDAARPAACQG